MSSSSSSSSSSTSVDDILGNQIAVNEEDSFVIAVDATGAMMYSWSTTWYTWNPDLYAMVEHTSADGYNQTDYSPVGYDEAKGLVMHPTAHYFYSDTGTTDYMVVLGYASNTDPVTHITYHTISTGIGDAEVVVDSTISSKGIIGLSTFLSENRPTTDTFHLEFAGVHKMSLLSTPTLVPVEMVRSSGVWALTGHYLVDMLPRDGVSSETESFVANEYQTTPLSRSTELEPGDLLGTFSSVLIQISTSALQDITTEPLITDIHDLHENIPVANDGPPQIELPPPPKYSAQSSWNA
eukprot:jgi/Undpi1/6819/HiC_scaffold_21.g09295.m1